MKACVRLAIIPKLIAAGRKILQARMPHCNVVFADTFLYIPLSLADLGAAMELPEQKGYFPFEILRPEFEDLIIPFPPKNAYPLEKMSAAKRADFDRWYDDERIRLNNRFDFTERLEHYCEVCYFFPFLYPVRDFVERVRSVGRERVGPLHSSIQRYYGRHYPRTFGVHQRLYVAEFPS